MTLLAAPACVIGLSDENPALSISPAGAEASVDASLDASSQARLDAAAGLDAAHAEDAAALDAAPKQDASSAPQSCMPSVPAKTCDPVKNTGCPLFTQCDVDPQASVPTGRCVFWTLSLGSACSADALSETCDAPNACLNGACHKPCYCKGDCAPGQCCREDRSLVPGGGFKVCGPC